MGNVRIQRGRELPPVPQITVHEYPTGPGLISLSLDHTDSSVLLTVDEDVWIWVDNQDNESITIDDLIEALQTAKEELENE
jgi:hypothetical protein